MRDFSIKLPRCREDMPVHVEFCLNFYCFHCSSSNICNYFVLPVATFPKPKFIYRQCLFLKFFFIKEF